jgi:hypothetical protein
VGYHAVQEIMKILGYRKVCSRWVPRIFTGTEEHKTAENCSPFHPTVWIWPPSPYHLFEPLKDHLREHHYETDKAVQEAMRNWMGGAGTDFYSRGIVKILQHWQKYIDRDRDFVRQ